MTFKAPWGREVLIVSVMGSLVVGIPTVVQVAAGHVVIGTILFTLSATIASLCVRGYELRPGELRIRRLFWSTRWPLDPTTRASVRPNVMQGSWRTWGNGGMFAVSGHFAGSGLGRYRAFVTDAARTVVLETATGIVVVSPHDPVAFVSAVATAAQPARH